MKPTIYEIARATKAKQPYFFTQGALKFFKQRMDDFEVKVSPKGNTYIYAPSTYKGKLMGYTFRQVKDNDLLRVGVNANKAENILAHIEAN